MDVLRLHVLLIDEDPELLNQMETCLVDQGLEVSKVKNQAEALKVIENRQIQVIVTDITMPENDGINLIKLLGDRIPFVMLRNGDDERLIADIDQCTCCFLDKSEISSRLPKAAWKAFQRFKIDKQISKEQIAA